MKGFYLFPMALLIALFGCTDENPVGAFSERAAFETETAAMAKAEEEDLAAMEAGMALFIGKFALAVDPDAGSVGCVDAGGTQIPGLPSLFTVANVTGNAYYLGAMTGQLIGEQCTAVLTSEGGVDHLVSTGTWAFTGEDGDALHGTYTTTLFPDGAFSFHSLITGGGRRFAGAAGWVRGPGTFDPSTGTGTFYGKGVVAPPVEVDDVQFQGTFTFAADTTAAPLPCVDPAGNPVPGVFLPSKLDITGLALHMGQTTGFFTLDACAVNADGSVSGPGTFGLTGAQGDGIAGTFAGTIRPDSTASTQATLTGGAGRFAGATGWFTTAGSMDLTAGQGAFDAEGWIYQPR